MSDYHSPRRAAAAAATRQAIVSSARELFLDRGYSAATIADIARHARVAVPTVYASVGGKADILRLIVEPTVQSPFVRRTIDVVAEARTGDVIIRATLNNARQAHELHWDLLYRLLPQCRVEPSAAKVLTDGSAAFIVLLTTIAARLGEVNALRDDIDERHAVDILWFHVGYQAWFSFVGEREWTFDLAERWLADSACHALLAPTATGQARRASRQIAE
jgi:AcrR family transcriptional regulator